MESDLRRLDALLDRMLTCILVADMAGLATLTAETAAVLDGVAAPTDAAMARRLREKAQYNATCLAATARGLRAAHRRLTEIRALRDGKTRLVTYDGSGKRTDTLTGPGRITHRI